MTETKQDFSWKIKAGDSEYTLHARDLTIKNLRQFKQWFGPSYGQYLTFIQLLMTGDADAVACALWLVKKNAGDKVPRDPTFLDFEVADFFIGNADDDGVADEEEDDGEPDPTNGPDTAE